MKKSRNIKDNQIFTNGSKGITLIALVITIIVLLILAGISTVILTGENGIIVKASNSKMERAHAGVVELIHLEDQAYRVENETDENNGTLIEYLLAKEIITEYESGRYQIDVEKLYGSKQPYGNGSDLVDVYMVEKTDVTLANGENKETIETKTTKLQALSYNEYIEGKSVESDEYEQTIKIAEMTNQDEYDIVYYDAKGIARKIGNLTDNGTGIEWDNSYAYLFTVDDERKINSKR
ncbi:MAG: hypothetical protein HUJ68_05425 [Clostridia bacterium]|nr:hypothetical protein [Clostridia bacterium]